MKSSKLKKKLKKVYNPRKLTAPPGNIHRNKKKEKAIKDWSHEIDLRDLAS